MTAPVVQKPTSESEKLQMTAPVIQRPSEEGWVMTFIMPSAYKMEDLPTPKDKRVSFETAPARIYCSPSLHLGWEQEPQ
ncbi:MAG: heme-binding protein [Deltaproteobacteria bacterium]|nr:heme-binding protein [Deltaproteobacteria bacterium]